MINNKNDIIKEKNNDLSIVKSQKKKKIFISCGEMSGDLHASYIVEEMIKMLSFLVWLEINR